MLPSVNSPRQTHSIAEGFQVVNITFVTAQNEVVLNDEHLLSLIQQYPFLFNPHVRPHKDEDYEAWAWEQITKTFNRSYKVLFNNVTYTQDELVARWKVLQPIVRSLSKPNNLKSLPDTLRHTLVKISVPMMENPNLNEFHRRPFLQKTLLEYEPLMNSLSPEDRRSLEAEIMELILNSELDSKATVKIGPIELQTVEKDCSEFYKILALAELDCAEENNGEQELNDPLTEPNCTNSSIAPNDITLETNIQNPKDQHENDDVQYIGSSTIEEEQFEVVDENLIAPIYKPDEIEEILQAIETEENLLTPLPEKDSESNKIIANERTIQAAETEENLLIPLPEKNFANKKNMQAVKQNENLVIPTAGKGRKSIDSCRKEKNIQDITTEENLLTQLSRKSRKSNESCTSQKIIQDIKTEENLLAPLSRKSRKSNESCTSQKIMEAIKTEEIAPKPPVGKSRKSNEACVNEKTMQIENSEENLLKPLIHKRWVPLNRWQDYVRNCRVRIKRFVMEDDDLPLAAINPKKIKN